MLKPYRYTRYIIVGALVGRIAWMGDISQAVLFAILFLYLMFD